MIHEQTQSLHGKEVAITGRLASMTRDEAVANVVTAGATYVAEPTEQTTVLVVGGGGWPLREDGRLTKSLERARDLQRSGHAIDMMTESEFVACLGMTAHGAQLRHLYSTQQLAKMLDVAPATVRTWTRMGLLAPIEEIHQLRLFDFSQVAAARDLARLVESGVSATRIAQSVRSLRRWLPAAFPLPPLELLDRTTIGVRLDDGTLAETNGQLRLTFALDSDRAIETEERMPRVLRTNKQRAEQWFARGQHAEESGHLELAAKLYQQALSIGSSSADAHFNLGNVLHSLGRKQEAAQQFEAAVKLDPDYVEAWNNLGNTRADLQQFEDSVHAYRRALAITPHYADAHYNLASVLQTLGRSKEAERHWRDYLRHDPASPWASEVRERLRDDS